MLLRVQGAISILAKNREGRETTPRGSTPGVELPLVLAALQLPGESYKVWAPPPKMQILYISREAQTFFK